MTEAESRTFARTAAVLLVASVVRWASATWGLEPVRTNAGPSILPELVEATERELAEERARERPLADGERVDPNRASDVELDRLPGVGPSTAAAIVASREREGPFQRPDDLLRVRGVGPATLARITARLDLDQPPAYVRGPDGSVTARADEGGEVRVDVNTASAAELQRLPGVGPVLAGRLVEARAKRRFGSVEDLLEVRGVGPATLERLRPLVVVR